MIAGRLNIRLEVLAPVTEVNAFGEQAVRYVTTCRVRAERVKLTGRRGDSATERHASYSAEFNVRAGHRFGEGWRVVPSDDPEGAPFAVVAIVPRRERGMLTLVCERVNV